MIAFSCSDIWKDGRATGSSLSEVQPAATGCVSHRLMLVVVAVLMIEWAAAIADNHAGFGALAWGVVHGGEVVTHLRARSAQSLDHVVKDGEIILKSVLVVVCNGGVFVGLLGFILVGLARCTTSSVERVSSSIVRSINLRSCHSGSFGLVTTVDRLSGKLREFSRSLHASFSHRGAL